MILASAPLLGWLVAIAAAVGYAVSAVGAQRLGPQLPRVAVRLAWLAHAAMLALAMFGPEARFGFAPALSVTAWLVGGVYAIESRVYPLIQTRWALSALGAMAVLLALIFPGNLLRPNTSIWLPLHWALGIASYGLFGIAVVHAWFMTRAEKQIRLAADAATGIPLLTMERLTFRFVGAGFLLLTATLLAGFLFDHQLYGSAMPFKWDHKTAFSVLSWLTFAVLLLGRQRFGWRGKRAVRVLYGGASLLLLAYVGSRFVLEVILGRTL